MFTQSDKQKDRKKRNNSRFHIGISSAFCLNPFASLDVFSVRFLCIKFIENKYVFRSCFCYENDYVCYCCHFTLDLLEKYHLLCGVRYGSIGGYVLNHAEQHAETMFSTIFHFLLSRFALLLFLTRLCHWWSETCGRRNKLDVNKLMDYVLVAKQFFISIAEWHSSCEISTRNEQISLEIQTDERILHSWG